MTSPCFIAERNRVGAQNNETNDSKTNICKEKVMSYEEKSVGTTSFFKCEACPYMALAEDDIKFHLFTFHPDLAKSNGLADNIQIACPGCASVFDAEETLRNHLRSHHKMGIKDIKKMVKSLVLIALSNVKLKKEEKVAPPPEPAPQEADVKIPQVIEIIPDSPSTSNVQLPNGVSFISVNELQHMSASNLIAPKDIQEASINIVYDNNFIIANTPNTIKPHLVTDPPPPDLISSTQPRPLVIDATATNINLTLPTEELQPQVPRVKPQTEDMLKVPKKTGEACKISGCYVRMHCIEKLHYHRMCHRDNKLICLECSTEFTAVEGLHLHLWRLHNIDLEMPTCPVCGYKTYKRSRLVNIHMKKHYDEKAYPCSECPKFFKTSHQLSKHRIIHRKKVKCELCHIHFTADHALKKHFATIHEKVRPFKCSECDFASARKEDLKMHVRMHTGDKPYACNDCEFRCSDHNSMRRHKKKHSQINTYKCGYCPYTCIQSTVFATHMINKHPDTTNNIFTCSYCKFKSINKNKLIQHLRKLHLENKGVHSLIESLNGDMKTSTLSWTIPISTDGSIDNEDKISTDQEGVETDNENVNIAIELDDCDSQQERIVQKYTSYNNNVAQVEQDLVTDLSKDENNSDFIISESSNDTTIDRQYTSQIDLTSLNYENANSYINSSVSIGSNLLQCTNVNSLTSITTSLANTVNSIMNNFPICLPPVPQISVRKNITFNPLSGPIIKPTQILPVPSSSNSPVNLVIEPEGAPRKKPKISVKSNLILKGPDQVDMFHSQQKMAFKRLEDNERFGLTGPVTFNNLITTQFMQIPPEPAQSESPTNLMPYCQDTMLSSTTNVTRVNSNPIFNFNSMDNINMVPQRKNSNDQSYIKVEATIKQNTQSPSLERMCTANVMINRQDYKASPPLEDIGKNMSEIKNELKSDAFYNIPMNNTAQNHVMDPYLIDNIIEQYPGHLDLSNVVLSEQMATINSQNDVIEIDDNSDDHKLISRFDGNYPLDSLYLMNNDFHFLDNDIQAPTEISNDLSRITEVPIINNKDTNSKKFTHFIRGTDDPMMNTAVPRHTNKINVKNIELLKN